MVKRIPLDNVCAKKIPTLSSQYDGLIDYVDISSVDNAEKRIVSMQCVSAKEAPSRAKQLLEVGDILVSTVRPNLNAVAMVEQQTDNLLVGSTGYCVLRCNDSIDKRYVFHFCQSPYFIDDMTSQATGASYPAVSSGIVKSSTIPDHPIEKQKLIADCLDKVSELIALRKEQLTKLDQLVKSRFIELFGDPVASENKKKLSEIGRVFTGNTPSMKEPSYYESNDIPFIKPSDLNENGVTSIDDVEAFVSEKARLVARIIPPNSVLVTCIGTIGKIGITTKESCCNQQINFIVPNDGINSVYLAHCLTFFKSTLQNIANAPVVPIINKTQFSELQIPVFEMDKQQRFATFVEQTDKSKLAIQQSLDKLETLKKSLMQEYFG